MPDVCILDEVLQRVFKGNFYFLLSAICVLHTLLRLLSKLFSWALAMKLDADTAGMRQTDSAFASLDDFVTYKLQH